jgi:uncharacterized protein DUF5666
MKRNRIWALLLVVAASGSLFAMPQASTASGTATKGSAQPAEPGPARIIYGNIQSIKGTTVTLKTRTGTVVQVDAKPAIAADRSVTLMVGHAIRVKGTVDKAGVLHAENLQKAMDSPTIWPADR